MQHSVSFHVPAKLFGLHHAAASRPNRHDCHVVRREATARLEQAQSADAEPAKDGDNNSDKEEEEVRIDGEPLTAEMVIQLLNEALALGQIRRGMRVRTPLSVMDIQTLRRARYLPPPPDDPGIIKFVRDDAGRLTAGIKHGKRANDCVCRAIAIASMQPYRKVYYDLLEMRRKLGKRSKYAASSHPRSGVYRIVYDRYLRQNGWVWVPCMRIGTGCKVHLKASELPMGRLIVSVSGHLTAVIDREIHDLVNPSRGGTRCVYGYYYHPKFQENPQPEDRQ